MSHSHIRVRATASVPKRRRWVEILLAVGVLTFFAAPVLWTLSRPPLDPEHERAPGKILDSRIDVAEIIDGNHGGRIFYRLQVNVRYSDGHGPQTRWMPAAEHSPSKEYLEGLVRVHAQTCQVYWLAEHPENPHCRFD